MLRATTTLIQLSMTSWLLSIGTFVHSRFVRCPSDPIPPRTLETITAALQYIAGRGRLSRTLSHGADKDKIQELRDHLKHAWEILKVNVLLIVCINHWSNLEVG